MFFENKNGAPEITTIESAKAELWREPREYNPLNDLEKIDNNFSYFGRNMAKENNLDAAIFLPQKAINHILLIGPTRSGKGVFSAVKAVEAIKKKHGLIYLNVKQEANNPQVILEELERQGRADDFLVVNWPYDFGYSGLSKNDTKESFFDKAVVLLNIKESENDGVGYYRKVERQTLLKLIQYLDIHFEKDWYSLLDFLKNVSKDLENRTKFYDELSKSKPNFDLISEYENLYYPAEIYKELDFNLENKTLFNLLKFHYMKHFQTQIFIINIH